MWKLLGIGIALLAAMGAFVFHLGWRSRHPGQPWPLGAVLSFAGGFLGAAGLVVGSWLVTAGGVALWVAARFVLHSPVA
jgi:cytochrome c oxidase assembly factor CtaG